MYSFLSHTERKVMVHSLLISTYLFLPRKSHSHSLATDLLSSKLRRCIGQGVPTD